MIALMLGSTGQHVQVLQLGLSRAGLYQGELDGIFGPHTDEAVKHFQSICGIRPTGVVARLTWHNLLPYIKGYRVVFSRAGYTLWDMAKQYGTSTSAILTANPDLDPMHIIQGTKVTIPLPFSLVPTNIGYSWELTSYIVDGLIMRYPFMRLEVTGYSVMKKAIYSIVIGDGSRKILANSSHHANEWITTPMLLKFLEEYGQAVAMGRGINGKSAARLMENNTLYAIPLVNPDGVDLVNGVIQDGPYYRTSIAFAGDYPDIPFPSGWKANIRGVDLNLQYPAGWDVAKEIKYAQGYTRPGPRDYVGSDSLSEPESQAVYKYSLLKNPDISLSFHTQGSVIYWKYLSQNPPGSKILGERMALASGYSLEDVPFISGHAGYKDWFILNYNRPGYTVEMGLGESPLPLEQFNNIYTAGKSILVEAMS